MRMVVGEGALGGRAVPIEDDHFHGEGNPMKKEKSQGSGTGTPTTTDPGVSPPENAAEAAIDDSMAVNRTLPVTPAASIVRPDKRYKPTDPDTRKKRLRRVADGQEAEALDAGKESAALGKQLGELLGQHAPDPAKTQAIVERVEAIDEALAPATSLVQFLSELREIALSDLQMVLERENKLYQTNVEFEPALAQHFKKLVKYFSLRGAAISAGKAQAKALESATEAAAAAGGDAKK